MKEIGDSWRRDVGAKGRVRGNAPWKTKQSYPHGNDAEMAPGPTGAAPCRKLLKKCNGIFREFLQEEDINGNTKRL
ncbi:MAG: hypothetical protein ACOYJB_01990 [Christensenellaceae bacterium]